MQVLFRRELVCLLIRLIEQCPRLLDGGSSDKVISTPMDVPPGTIVKEGWLFKRGEHFRNWKSRYFILLDNGKFLGFKRKPNENEMGRPLNNITIIGCQVMVVDKPKLFRFNIRSQQATTAIERMFSVDSQEERERWVVAIKRISENVSSAGETYVDAKSQTNEKLCEDFSLLSPACPFSTPIRRVTLEDFELIKVLGKGSFGKVNLCREKATRQLVAVKIMIKEAIVRKNEVAHILTESKVLKSTNYPFLTSLKYSFHTNERLFFVMEYAQGGELYVHLEKEVKFSEDKTRFYGAEIILAIAYLHSLGTIYRDLKMENILLDRDGHIKIADFGLCKENITDDQPAHTFCGTPEYMAPEVLKGEPYGRAVDWWATGAVMYEMIHGHQPFYHPDKSTLQSLIISKRLKLADISVEGKALLNGLLTKKPNLRLGGGPDGAEEIKSHPFFAPINWRLLEQKKIPPPTKPYIKNDEDTTYFDARFENESVQLTPLDEHYLETASTTPYFKNFSFQDLAPIIDNKEFVSTASMQC